ncbi:hypothetical protein NG791_27875 [Laspinema sp. D1]|uniref:hypothetical protein n=2 Tax=Oscillatoriales TaxID=1150 RepID=UPI003498D7E2|nr:hypothetical protein [Laspinema sp. D2b]
MINCECFEVPVYLQSNDSWDIARLEPALHNDMPSRGWSCHWPTIWENTDFEQGGIIKLTASGQIWGLMRFEIFPSPSNFIEIFNLETTPANRQPNPKLVAPVGKWLVWYAVNKALEFFQQADDESPIVVLESVEAAFDYYRDIIQMHYEKPVSIAPGEDGYVFSFSPSNARNFCQRIEKELGNPTPVKT